MAYSVELCVGEFMLAIEYNVRIFWIAELKDLEGNLCFILIPLFSKYHFISSGSFNSWSTLVAKSRWDVM